MSDRDLRVEPTRPAIGPAPVQTARHQAPLVAAVDRRQAPEPSKVAATTGGNLRAAYAQYDVNPDTHDVVLRIRDATTDQVISETPTREVQAMSKYLNDYAATLARHRLALKSPADN